MIFSDSNEIFSETNVIFSETNDFLLILMKYFLRPMLFSETNDILIKSINIFYEVDACIFLMLM